MNIFLHIDPSDLRNCARSCKTLKHRVTTGTSTDYLWKARFEHRSLILSAVHQGWTDVVRRLVCRRQYPVEYLNIVLLPAAAEIGHIEVVRLLLDQGAYAKYYRVLSCGASSNGYLEIVRLIL